MLLEKVAESVDRQFADLKFRIFSKWDYNLQNIFLQIESECFPPELAYSKAELLEIEKRDGFEGMIIFRQESAIATVLIDTATDPYCLNVDTFAVARRGERLGTVIMDSLIKASLDTGFSNVSLDTEKVNSKGQHLVEYYKRFGFKEESSQSSNGNIHMCRMLK